MSPVTAEVPDSWDDEPSASSSASTQFSNRPAPSKRAVAAAVPDDWDDESNDEAVEPDSDLNKKIWQDANTRAPMPEVLVKSATGGTGAVIAPPPAAFQAPMRILKRPTSAAPSARSDSSSRNAESLQEREARYHAARERIFGLGEAEGGSAAESTLALSRQDNRTNKPGSHTSKPSVPVVRAPLGPSEGIDGQQNHGFSGRSRAPAPPSVADEPGASAMS
ncbi:hypothetical protein HGRIS_012269 [Hohenbuehelia grisea]|uniref:SUZ domain-containing protein n=1 Tax=Hohenbuehelia grisea TaxID=104357 RepID=A0ABR3IRQ2_9AGAR